MIINEYILVRVVLISPKKKPASILEVYNVNVRTIQQIMLVFDLQFLNNKTTYVFHVEYNIKSGSSSSFYSIKYHPSMNQSNFKTRAEEFERSVINRFQLEMFMTSH